MKVNLKMQDHRGEVESHPLPADRRGLTEENAEESYCELPPEWDRLLEDSEFNPLGLGVPSCYAARG